MNAINDFFDFLKSQFDKILLAVLFVLGAHYVFIASRLNQPALVTWLESIVSGFSGALLTLITGRLQAKSNNSNQGGVTPTNQAGGPPAKGQNS